MLISNQYEFYPGNDKHHRKQAVERGIRKSSAAKK